MLTDPDRYFISKGLTTYNSSVDLKNKVILNHKPNQYKNLQYTYGELDEQPHEQR